MQSLTWADHFGHPEPLTLMTQRGDQNYDKKFCRSDFGDRNYGDEN
jgi:hypothetical protein